MILAVSPHLDDAALSAGATLAALAETGRRVVVCTVFAGQPQGSLSQVAQRFHRSCGQDDDAIAERRQEDEAAATVLGAEPMHLEFLDAIYRRVGDGWLCRHDDAMFDPRLPDESDLRHAIDRALRRVVDDLRPDFILTAAGIGGHVDHWHTAVAASDLGLPVLVWQDLPYALDEAGPGRANLLPTLTDRHLERKLAAVACYRSQIRMLWPRAEDWAGLLRRHATLRGAPTEWIWSRDLSKSEGNRCE